MNSCNTAYQYNPGDSMDRKVFKWILTGASAAIILAAAIYFTAGYFRSPAPGAGSTSEGDHDDIKVAAVGDSTTYGLLINNRSENAYPAKLDSLLGGGYWVGNFGANNYAAMKSADFPYYVTEEYQNSLAFNPDITVIILGTNDSRSEERRVGKECRSRGWATPQRRKAQRGQTSSEPRCTRRI